MILHKTLFENIVSHDLLRHTATFAAWIFLSLCKFHRVNMPAE